MILKCANPMCKADLVSPKEEQAFGLPRHQVPGKIKQHVYVYYCKRCTLAVQLANGQEEMPDMKDIA